MFKCEFSYPTFDPLTMLTYSTIIVIVKFHQLYSTKLEFGVCWYQGKFNSLYSHYMLHLIINIVLQLSICFSFSKFSWYLLSIYIIPCSIWVLTIFKLVGSFFFNNHFLNVELFILFGKKSSTFLPWLLVKIVVGMP